MKNREKFTGILTNLTRLPKSLLGNPRYSFKVDGHTIATSPNSGYAYFIDGLEGKHVSVLAGLYYGRLTLDGIAVTKGNV